MNLKEHYQQLADTILAEHTAAFAAQNLDEVRALMDMVKAADRIFVMGVGREGISTRAFAMRLMHLGKEVHWIWDDTTPGMGKGICSSPPTVPARSGISTMWWNRRRRPGPPLRW